MPLSLYARMRWRPAECGSRPSNPASRAARGTEAGGEEVVVVVVDVMVVVVVMVMVVVVVMVVAVDVLAVVAVVVVVGYNSNSDARRVAAAVA